MAHTGRSEEDDAIRRMNDFFRKMNEQASADNTSLQAIDQGAFLPTMSSQQAGTSSRDATVDALSRQIMMAGMAALGLNNPALQKQLATGESNVSSSTVSHPISSFLQSNVNGAVPDGSGLQRYREPDTESFVFDIYTGYRFDPTTGLHYDANTGFFINVRLKIFMRWDPVTNTYMRENKRPPQNVGPVPMSLAAPILETQPTIPNVQSLLLSLMGKSLPDRSIETLLPAAVPSPTPIGQQGTLLNELYKNICKNEGNDSGNTHIPESANLASGSKTNNGKDRERPRGSRRTSRSTSGSSDRGGTSRKRRDPSSGRERSKSSSREASKRRRRRRSKSGSREARKGRRSRSSSREGSKRRRSRSYSTESSDSRSRSRSRGASRRKRSRSKHRRDDRRSRSRSQGRRREKNHHLPWFHKKQPNKWFNRPNNQFHSKQNKFNNSLLHKSAAKAQKLAQKKPGEKKIVCYKCGMGGHYRTQCNSEGKFCYGCLKVTDHISSNCPCPITERKTEEKAQANLVPNESNTERPDSQEAVPGNSGQQQDSASENKKPLVPY